MKRLPWKLLWWVGMAWSVPFVLMRLLAEGLLWLQAKVLWTLVQPGIWAMGVANERLDP